MTNISQIDHIAIVVKSIDEVKSFYEQALGLKIDSYETLEDRGIRTAFIPVGQTKIELIEPLHDQSQVSKFLENKGPGIHHVAFATENISADQEHIKNCGAKLTYEKEQSGAHESKVNFIHPKSSGGVLIELVENKKS